ncbi:CRAL-TRIO domain-containing protein C3H8.02-like isoform X1 [Chiloscyllium plagiosum]|uniref:CRAL-TRIO domain-containing protein C3H8.02-like isoform X1 n=1 Tax=Chiloscyllium plagiosum TaxID=36176 RepID=UPI001CB7B981|nr:CRAL-TRIO domain-containing protein C3H8.02-like isoform X1 [Chiloscyllium plagiosum]
MTSRNHRSQNGMASSARENESLASEEGSCPTVSDSEENKVLLEQKAKDISNTFPKDLNDKAFARFLRAFRSVDQAFNAILRYLKWRKEFGVDSITVEDSDIKTELRSGKAVLLEEKDNAGRQLPRWDLNSELLARRPILLVTAKLHHAKDRNLQSLMKFIVYLLETAGKQCDDDICDNFCIVFDMKDFSMNSMDYQFVKNLIWLLSNYYPERLGIWLIVNPPVLFSGCWVIIRSWLDENTAKKVTFITKPEQLAEYIRLEVLPRNLFL